MSPRMSLALFLGRQPKSRGNSGVVAQIDFNVAGAVCLVLAYLNPVTGNILAKFGGLA